MTINLIEWQIVQHELISIGWFIVGYSGIMNGQPKYIELLCKSKNS